MWPYPIFLINLKASPDRRRAALQQLARQGLAPRLIEAVDGRALPPEEIARLVDAEGRLRRAPKPLSPAEVGCYLSHRAVLERIVAEAIPQALVLEDDLTAGDELAAVLQAIAARPMPPYDVIKLGISEPQEKAFTPILALTETSWLVRHHNVVNSNLAYVITRAGAERFLAYGRPIRYPVDVAMNRAWRHGLDILAVRPWPVLPNPAFASTIGADRFEDRAVGGIGLRLQRRARKAYDSLAKRLDVGRRIRGDAAWLRNHRD
ncbi:MAG TPA: glycosyltransferase family 25 protein [Phenylobacterium sp.]|uniref:glycosyltransferase family 25 protein n=1 Tax=Phenylobacterium sp. TaxID=1871053 RepID=UPI002D067B00|nr:glycosyltransferase family 25 protein [Phenylobacterium sp.]HSV03286.1 glycosyltransferase family 25 protein [Phenylobacterium sp.]